MYVPLFPLSVTVGFVLFPRWFCTNKNKKGTDYLKFVFHVITFTGCNERRMLLVDAQNLL